jgi:hypothetical protein
MTPAARTGVTTREPSPRGSSATRIAKAVFALLVLNALLSFSAWWPTPGVVLDDRIAPEFVGLWLMILALVFFASRLSRPMLAGLTIAYMLLVLGRYLDVTIPSMFGRPINVFWDIPQLPRFLWVTAMDWPWWRTAALLVGVGLLVTVIYRVTSASIRVVAREAAPYALRARWVWAVTAAATALVAANYAGVRATWPYVSKPVVPTYWRQAQILVAAFWSERQAVVLPPSTALEAARARPAGTALAALHGRDVYLMMLESYGAVAYEDPRALPALAAARKRFAADLAAGKHLVATAFMRSPTFAGASDLAQLSVLSGIDLSDPMRHDVLLTTGRPTLTSLFREQGYQTFGVYPALSWDWPESKYYGFETFIEGRTLGWRGPQLGYWSVPDQFTMARLEQLHPRDAQSRPRFVFFPTITSHLPFSPVPPFQPDRDKLLSATPFDGADVQRAQAEAPRWTDMFPDYVRMFEYAYRWLGHHLRQGDPRETVYLLVGDHQPAANITGEGASWDVPVHVVTSDRTLLQRFVAQGFTVGLDAPRAPIGGLHDLTGLALKAFADDAPRALQPTPSNDAGTAATGSSFVPMAAGAASK